MLRVVFLRSRQRRVPAVQAEARLLLHTGDQNVAWAIEPWAQCERRHSAGFLRVCDRAGGMDQEAACAEDVEIVDRGQVEETGGNSLDRAGVDGGVVADLGAELEGIGKQALTLGIAPDRPGLLNAGGGDTVCQLLPGTLRIVPMQAVEGIGIDESAPLYRQAHPY